MIEKLAAIKYFTDTNVAKAVAVQLRNRGVDVVRCEEVGMAAANDAQLLAYAAEKSRVMVSHDDDFLNLDRQWRAEGRTHAGIMYVLPHLQGKPNVGRIIAELEEYDQLIGAGAGSLERDIHNRVIFISSRS